MKKYLEAITNVRFSAELIVLLLGSAFLSILFLFAKTYWIPHPTYLNLPYNTTVFAMEYKSNLNSPQVKALIQKTSLPNSIRFINSFQELVPEFSDLKLPNLKSTSHTLTLQKLHEGTPLIPVLIITTKVPIEDDFPPSDFNLPEHLSLKVYDKNIYISPSELAIENLLLNRKTLQVAAPVQDVLTNLPKNGIFDLYFNHNLVTDNINTLFNITMATLQDHKSGLILSTYTSPKPETTFPYSRTKYLANIPENLPSHHQFLLGGTNATPRIIQLLQNLPQFKNSETALPNYLIDILNSYNLSIDSLELLMEIFKSEYAITYSEDTNWSLIFNSLNKESTKKLQSELEQLSAYFSPKKVPYTLGDDTLSYQLIPDENQKATIVSPELTSFQFKELNQSLLLGNHNSEYTFLTSEFTPFIALSTEETFFSEDNFYQTAKQLLLPYANEMLYLKKEFLHPYLSHKFDLRNIPNIFSISNFFTDGIQTITLLQW